MSKLRKKWECEKRSGVGVWGGGGEQGRGVSMFNTLVIFPFSFIVVIAFVTSPGKIQKNSTFLHGLNMNSFYFLFFIIDCRRL